LNSYNPLAPLALIWRYRELALPLAGRKISARYRGSLLGMLWAVLNPLLMLGIYTFIFSVVFQSKWGLDRGDKPEFALFLFSGLILYSVFSECLNEAPALLLNNKLYIKQLVFPTEILAWVTVLNGLFNLVINFVILVIFQTVVMGPPTPTLLYFPLIVLPIVLITLGSIWFVASIGIYLRDLGHIVRLFTTALLFLSPIFYPASRVPERFQAYYTLNPFGHLLEMSKGVLFYEKAPDPTLLGACLAGSWAFSWLGYMWFMRAKKGFADVV
jgi:lipopolysaccharide transport system permease protein